ncbi:glycosyltransferase [Pseudomonas sp. sia0905]|uniref:glycosyltransferase n=1 Tax=Pseudomonas sp. sia0905 TaxID=2854783 RepID=UPI001C4535BE|nr:glycosyltransferase [Pseudomonas sp. sia0905]MBV7563368.1 glycosyltransferase [Pseudomonas sp. sia0905]
MPLCEPSARWVLQFCHSYDGPFLDCARQYAVLFKGTPYKVCTVYLTGSPSVEVEQGSASDEVIFLDYASAQVRGLKLAAIRDFKRIVATRDFALCIAHRFKPVYIALLGSALPVIGVHHAFGDYQRRSRQLFANFFARRLSLLGVSNAVCDDMRACLGGWPSDRIETLYNRIDVEAVQAEQVSREVAREHLGLPQDAWIVGNVGRLHPDKDQATLIRGFAMAFSQLPPDSLLVLMGSGRLDRKLKALATELGVSESVRFIGQIPNGRRYFKAFDQFVLSSDHEPFGMVLLEAMAAGISVLASDCGGAPEVVPGADALFPLADAEVLATRLRAATTHGDKAGPAGVQPCFTDAGAFARFWTLPSVRRVLKEEGSDA